MKSELAALRNRLILECSKYNLAFDLSIQPVKLGPDCYYFYATHVDPICRRVGICKEVKFYLLTGGEELVILDRDGHRLIKTPEGTHRYTHESKTII